MRGFRRDTCISTCSASRRVALSQHFGSNQKKCAHALETSSRFVKILSSIKAAWPCAQAFCQAAGLIFSSSTVFREYHEILRPARCFACAWFDRLRSKDRRTRSRSRSGDDARSGTRAGPGSGSCPSRCGRPGRWRGTCGRPGDPRGQLIAKAFKAVESRPLGRLFLRPVFFPFSFLPRPWSYIFRLYANAISSQTQERLAENPTRAAFSYPPKQRPQSR